MSVNVSEMVIAGASVLSAIFVGYQSMLLRETLVDQRLSDLHVNQIRSCSEFLLAADGLKSAYQTWGIAERGEMPSLDLAPYKEQFLFSARDKSIAFVSKAREFKYFFDSATISDVDLLMNANVAMELAMGKNEPMTKENDDLVIQDFQNGYDRIQKKCRKLLPVEGGGEH